MSKSNIKNANANVNTTTKNSTVKDNQKIINNDEVDQMKKNANDNVTDYYGPTPVTYKNMIALLETIIKKHEKIEDINKKLQAIKIDYKQYKTDYIQSVKDVQYTKPVKNVDFIIEYPDIMLTQDSLLKIVNRTRVLLFHEWYNNHFKTDDVDADNRPILKNSDLVSFQSKIFLRLSEEAKNKNSDDIIISKSDLKREGQRLFSCIIDDGEGIFGGFQLKYCLLTIAQQATDAKEAREVHRDLFSKILFSAFAEGDFKSRQQKNK